MKIHLKQIPVEGLHLEGEDDCPIREMEAEGIRCAGLLRYNLDVGVSGDSLWVSGSLIQPVQLGCVACLEEFPFEVRVPDFAIQMELPGPEIVDLTPLLREDILLNLPAHPHCDREGDRICKAAHLESAPGSEAKRKSDWSALDKLKLKN
jgi:uncharacterized metal-binding protein YceD (DUF177 family)